MSNIEFSPELIAIRERFEEGLPERVQQLQEAMSDWSCDDSMGGYGFESLSNLTHQLTGTAGSLGFTALSLSAKDLNLKLRQLAAMDHGVADEDALSDIKASYVALITEAQSCVRQA